MIKSWHNYKLDINKQYQSDLPSNTLPDEAYTMRELYNKYAIGTIDTVFREGQFDDDDTPFDAPLTPDRLRLTDPAAIREQTNIIKSYVEQTLNDAKQKIDEYVAKQQATNIQSQVVSENQEISE